MGRNVWDTGVIAAARGMRNKTLRGVDAVKICSVYMARNWNTVICTWNKWDRFA